MSYDFNMSLTEIWNKVKRPFVAIDKNGWLVMIKVNPNIQVLKYGGRIYGRIDRNIGMLYLKTRTRPIDKANLARWKLYEVIPQDSL